MFGKNGSTLKATARSPNLGPADAVAQAIAQYKPSILVAGVKQKSDSPGPHGTVFALLASSRVPVLCVPAEAGTVQDPAERISVTAS